MNRNESMGRNPFTNGGVVISTEVWAGADLRPEAGGKRLGFLYGDLPDRAHLTALLYQWQPDLFKPSPEELAAAESAQDEGAAWTTAQAKTEDEAGPYT